MSRETKLTYVDLDAYQFSDGRVVIRKPGTRPREFVQREQWRFMWCHAIGDENGAQWRDEPPTQEEIAEWLVDFRPGAVWIERRTILEGEPQREEYP